jgi:type II secretory pathway component GspD/PulD (secretin)
LSLTPLTTALGNKFSISSALSGVLTFGGGKTLIGLGITTPQLVATMSNTVGKVLYETILPALEGQAASMHIGERYPIASGTYSAVGANGSATPGAYVPPPMISYEDLGLSMKVTHRVHVGGEVTMDVDAEFKLLTGESVSGLPVIRNRVVKSTVRMATGQWAVLAGLLNPSDATILTGLTGVSRIPLLSALTSKRQRNKDTDQVLILLRPSIQALPPAEFSTRTYCLGSETRPRIPL